MKTNMLWGKLLFISLFLVLISSMNVIGASYQIQYVFNNTEQNFTNVTVTINLNSTNINYSRMTTNIAVTDTGVNLNYWLKLLNASGTSTLEVLIPTFVNNTQRTIIIDYNSSSPTTSSEPSVYPLLYDTFQNSSSWIIGTQAESGFTCSGSSLASMSGGLATLSAQANTFAHQCTAYAITNTSKVPLNFTQYSYNIEVGPVLYNCSSQGCLHQPVIYVTNLSTVSTTGYSSFTAIPDSLGMQWNYYRDFPFGPGIDAESFDMVFGNKTNAPNINYIYPNIGTYRFNGTTNPTVPFSYNLLWNNKLQSANMTVKQAGILYSDVILRSSVFSKGTDYLRLEVYEDQDGVGVTSAQWNFTKIKRVFANGEVYTSSPVNTQNNFTGTTGGNVTFDGNYAVITFLANTTLNVSFLITNATIMVIGGGGGGGGATGNVGAGGGGGAGGYQYNTSFNIPVGSYNVVIGAGGLAGASGTPSVNGTNGQTSSFLNITSIGGGGGGNATKNGGRGGAGGGGGGGNPFNTIGGVGIQGFNGGAGANAASGAGGGGSGTAGQTGINVNSAAGKGGNGTANGINGNASIRWAAGGGGGCSGACAVVTNGGLDGGANGGRGSTTGAGNGTNGTGGGGGGGSSQGSSVKPAGNGGSGIVILRFLPNQVAATTNVTFPYSNNAYTNNNNLTYGFVTGSTAFSNATYNIIVLSGSGSNDSFTTNETNHTFANLFDGKYYYDLTVYDTNNNNVYFDPNITIDTVSPSINYFANTTANNSVITSEFGSIYVSVNASDINFNSTIINLYNASNALINSSLSNNTATAVSFFGLNDGVYYFNATAYDLAGNINSTVTYMVTVDVHIPTINFNNNSDNRYVNRNNIFVNVSADDTNLQSINIYLYNSTGNLINNNSCYQEFANVSNECGALSTGTYYQDIITGTGDSLWNDGDYNTGYTGAFNGTDYINYTKPIGANSSSLWQVKYRANTFSCIGTCDYITNITIPSGCFNQSTLQFKVRMISHLGLGLAYMMVNGSCYNGTDWEQLFGVDDTLNRNDIMLLYEEGIYWKGILNSTTANFTNLADGLYYVNATAFDVGASNSTETRNITIITSFKSNLYNVTFPYPDEAYTNNNTLTYGFNTTDTNYNYTTYNIYRTRGAGMFGCYQESPNTTNQTGLDGSCGLNYSGYVLATTGSITKSRGNDGDVNTYVSNFSNIGLQYVQSRYYLPSPYIAGVILSVETNGANCTQYAPQYANFAGTGFITLPNFIGNGTVQNYTIYNNLNNTIFWQNSLWIQYPIYNDTNNVCLFGEDSVTWQVINSTAVSTTNTSYTTTLLDGKYYYGLTIYNKAGFSKLYDPNLTIDTVSPNVSFIPPTPNNNQIVYIKFGTLNFTTSINVSDDNDNISLLTVYLYHDASLIQTFDWTNITNSTRDYNFSVITSVNGTYYINATAYDLAGNLGVTETRQINATVDTVFPVINFSLNNTNFNPNNNISILSRDKYNLTYNVTYTDDNLFAAEVNVTCDVSGTIYNWSFVGFNVTSYTKADNFSISYPMQRCTFFTAASDSHTSEEIPKYDNAVLDNGLSFLTENDNVVQVIANEPISNIQDISTQKLKDRQTFNFDFVDSDNTRTFRLLSNNIIYYLPESIYPAHFVIWNSEEHKGNWVDFVDKVNKGDTYSVTKVNDYEYDITITTSIPTDKLEFSSIGGTLITNFSAQFYIGASIYTTAINNYTNATFLNSSYVLIQHTGFPLYNHAGDLPTNNSVAENLTNGTYTYTLSNPHYFNRSYEVNITNDSIVQNYTTYQSQANLRFVAFARNVFLNNVTYILTNNLQNITTTGNTGNSSLLTLDIDASSYTINYSIPGYNNGSFTFSTSYLQNLTTDVDVSYQATFNLFDEKTLGVFNLSAASLVTFQLYCPNSTYYTTVNSTNFSVPINCDYTSFKFQLDYNGTATGYYRSFILTPDETNNVPIYLIDATTTPYIYNSLVADDLLKIYINPRIYVYKNINNLTVQITANFVDITQKVSAYLIENNQYTVVIKSDNLPDYTVGLYAADTSGTVSIKLYQMSLYYNGNGDRNPLYYLARIDNSTGDYLVLGSFTDTLNQTQLVQFNTYADNVLLSSQSVPNTGSAVFTTNVSNQYNTSSIYGEFVITNVQLGTVQQKSLLHEISTIDLGIWSYVSHDTVNWILIILLGLLAVIGTIQTANYVSIALIFLGALFVIFGWLTISASVLAIAGFVALISLLKEGERNS